MPAPRPLVTALVASAGALALSAVGAAVLSVAPVDESGRVATGNGVLPVVALTAPSSLDASMGWEPLLPTADPEPPAARESTTPRSVREKPESALPPAEPPAPAPAPAPQPPVTTPSPSPSPVDDVEPPAVPTPTPTPTPSPSESNEPEVPPAAPIPDDESAGGDTGVDPSLGVIAPEPITVEAPED